MNYLRTIFFMTSLGIYAGCGKVDSQKEIQHIFMIEQQVTSSPKTHALDNNDNFSPDGHFLCYDTRGTIYNENLANSKSIEKVEISTGEETVLWDPPSITGEDAAPGVAAVSFHPIENKVVFIHGPMLAELEERNLFYSQSYGT